MSSLIGVNLCGRGRLHTTSAIGTCRLHGTLFLGQMKQNSPRQRGLVLTLYGRTKNLRGTFTTTFNPRTKLFFTSSVHGDNTAQQRFLQGVTIKTTLIALTDYKNNPTRARRRRRPPISIDSLRGASVQINFVPVAYTAPVVVSRPLNFCDGCNFDTTIIGVPD